MITFVQRRKRKKSRGIKYACLYFLKTYVTMCVLLFFFCCMTGCALLALWASLVGFATEASAITSLVAGGATLYHLFTPDAAEEAWYEWQREQGETVLAMVEEEYQLAEETAPSFLDSLIGSILGVSGAAVASGGFLPLLLGGLLIFGGRQNNPAEETLVNDGGSFLLPLDDDDEEDDYEL
jgi:hypothetical protein